MKSKMKTLCLKKANSLADLLWYWSVIFLTLTLLSGCSEALTSPELPRPSRSQPVLIVPPTPEQLCVSSGGQWVEGLTITVTQVAPGQYVHSAQPGCVRYWSGQ